MQAEYVSAKMTLDSIEEYIDFIGDNYVESTSSKEIVVFIKKLIEINTRTQLKMEEIDGRISV